MYLVAIAWIYVVLMMAVAEATNTTGTLLGAIITFVLYGVMPLALVMYLLATPARRAAKREAEQAALQRINAAPDLPAAGPPQDGQRPSSPPDGSDHAAGDTVAAERKEA
jgi:hypothetical protein